MRLSVFIKVGLDGMYHNYAAGKDITELQQYELFEPLRTTDDPLMAMVTGEMLEGSPVAEKVLRTRKDAAEILARELTEIIIDAMKANDTHNGYKV